MYRAFDSDEALEVAWNKLHVERLSKHELEKVSNEVKLLERIQHKNIIRFHALLPSTERNGVKSIDFITEQMTSGTLKDYLKRAKAIKLKVIRRWSFNILGAITYLHCQQPPIMHRDLKCDNIFINGHVGEVKIGDLGLSGVKLRDKADSVIGTPEFMAPEVYDGKYTEKVDIYAFGMCLLEMVTMEYPYSECNSFAQIFKKVYSGEKPKVLDRILPGPFKNVINACLQREANRPSASQLLEDPLFKDWNQDEGTKNNISLLVGSNESRQGDANNPGGNVIEWSDPLDRALMVSTVNDPPQDAQTDPAAHSQDDKPLEVSVLAQVNETGGFKVGLTIPIENQIKRVEFPFDPFIDTAEHLARELVEVFHLPEEQIANIEEAIKEQIERAWKQREAHVRNTTPHATPHPPPPNDVPAEAPTVTTYPADTQSRSAYTTETAHPSYAAVAASGTVSGSAPSAPPSVPHPQSEPNVQESAPRPVSKIVTPPQNDIGHQEPVYQQQQTYAAPPPQPTTEHEHVQYQNLPVDASRSPVDETANFYSAQTQSSIMGSQQATVPAQPVEQLQATQPIPVTQPPVHEPQVHEQVVEQSHLPPVQQQVVEPQSVPQVQVEPQQELQVPHQVVDQRHGHELQQHAQQAQELQHMQQVVPPMHQQLQDRSHVEQRIPEASHIAQVQEHRQLPPQVAEHQQVSRQVAEQEHGQAVPQQMQESRLMQQQDMQQHAVPEPQHVTQTIPEHQSLAQSMPQPQSSQPLPAAAQNTDASVVPDMPVESRMSSQPDVTGLSAHAMTTSAGEGGTGVQSYMRHQQKIVPGHSSVHTPSHSVPVSPMPPPQSFAPPTYSTPMQTQNLTPTMPVSRSRVSQNEQAATPSLATVHTISQPRAVPQPVVATRTPQQAPIAQQQATHIQPSPHPISTQHAVEDQNYQASIPQQGHLQSSQPQAPVGHNEGGVPPAPSPPLSVQSNTFASIESVPENSEIGSQQGSEHGTQSVRYVEVPTDAAYSSQMSETDSQTRENRPHTRLPPTAPAGFSTTQTLMASGSSSISHSASEQVLRRNEQGADLIAPHRSISAPAGSINTDEPVQFSHINAADNNPVLSTPDQSLLAELTRPEPVSVSDPNAPMRSVPHSTSNSNVASESKPPSIVVVGGGGSSSERRHSNTEKTGRTRPSPGNISSASLPDYSFNDPNYVPRSSSLTGNVSDAPKRPYSLNEPLNLAPPITMGRRSSSWRSTQSETSFHDGSIRASPSDTTLGSTYDQKWLASCLELMEHSAKGRYGMVLQKLDMGISPSFADYDRRTPLHVAASRGHLDIVTLLIERGANMKAVDRWGRTPLSDAIVNQHQNVASFLRSHGATEDMDVTSDAFGSITLESVAKGDLEEVRRRLVAGANANFADYDQRTALHLACTEGHSDIAELLLVNEADWTAKDSFGRTPVDDAVRNGHKEILRVLRQYGAEIPRHLLGAHSDSQHQQGLDLVENAAKGRINAVRKCLLNGANPNFQDYDRRTALHLAAVEGHADIVELLLKSGADSNSLDRWGETPKDGALKEHQTAVVDEFVNWEKKMVRRNSGLSTRGSYANGRRSDSNSMGRNFEKQQFVGEDFNDLRSLGLKAAAASKMRPSQMHVFADSFVEHRASRSGSRPLSAPPPGTENITPPVMGEQQPQGPLSPYRAGTSPIQAENVLKVSGSGKGIGVGVTEEVGKGSSSVVTVESEGGEAIATEVVTSIVDEAVDDVGVDNYDGAGRAGGAWRNEV